MCATLAPETGYSGTHLPPDPGPAARQVQLHTIRDKHALRFLPARPGTACTACALLPCRVRRAR
eukprot:3267540-Alexandrium_andersonii.AAC.1